MRGQGRTPKSSLLRPTSRKPVLNQSAPAPSYLRHRPAAPHTQERWQKRAQQLMQRYDSVDKQEHQRVTAELQVGVLLLSCCVTVAGSVSWVVGPASSLLGLGTVTAQGAPPSALPNPMCVPAVAYPRALAGASSAQSRQRRSHSLPSAPCEQFSQPGRMHISLVDMWRAGRFCGLCTRLSQLRRQAPLITSSLRLQAASARSTAICTRPLQPNPVPAPVQCGRPVSHARH